MKLLIITQKVDQDDSYFGFFHEWLRAFAENCEQVTVITLERRRYTLPDNVTVLSLGKEYDSSRLSRLLLFWKYAWQERASYGAVFCHMSPLYVIVGYSVWKPLGKKIALWYSHRHADLKLRIAVLLADAVFSTTPEAFRAKTSKAHFMGHAVDAAAFARLEEYPQPAGASVIAVGRITPIKRLEVLITALGILLRRGIAVQGTIVGAPLMSSDKEYAAGLARLVAEQGLGERVTFTGSIPFGRIREEYWKNDLSVNLAPTGGMDKVVLEALAAGTPTIVANAAFAEVLKGYEGRLITTGEAADLADKIEAFLKASDREAVARTLAERVRSTYSFNVLMPAIIRILETV